MQLIFFAIIAFTAIFLNLLATEGFFNVSDRLFWKQTTNLLSQQQPVKLDIPAVRIGSSIERVGIDTHGNMQAPSTPKLIAWYQFGALPGEKGNLVLSGHKDSKIGPGVFYTLGKVQPGDTVTVTAADKKQYVYRTNYTITYDSEDLPVTDIFSDQKREKKIYLITCAGSWDIFNKKYDKRILVEGKLKEN